MKLDDTRGPGYDALWSWFGLTRAAWLTLPRSLMHAMPQEWQGDMARLLAEFDARYQKLPAGYSISVNVRVDGRFAPMPDWMWNYRHPDSALLRSFQTQPDQD